jgi:glucose-1-phosphate adenylyltransferase
MLQPGVVLHLTLLYLSVDSRWEKVTSMARRMLTGRVLTATKEGKMGKPRVLTLVMAGGAGSRMSPLTEARAKPALPFGGIYKLIDFPLSNSVHSGLSDVWVIEQFQPQALNDHLANGRPWDLDRTYGGLRIMPPHVGTEEGGWHQGNADAIYRNRRFIREFNPDIVLVLSADHIYTFDYQIAIAAHLKRDAGVTMVPTQRPREQAKRHGVIQADGQGKVTDFAYKPEQPASETVATEIFVYNAQVLLETIDELMAQKNGGTDGDEAALKDFGHELIPALTQQGRAYAIPMDGYWRDVGTISSYWMGHMDLFRPTPPLNLDNPAWPILTYGVQRLPARIEDTAQIAQSLIAPGCHIRGRVERSVLGPGVVVEAGATVRDSVIFENVVIAAGATVERAIVDSEARIGGRDWAHRVQGVR